MDAKELLAITLIDTYQKSDLQRRLDILRRIFEAKFFGRQRAEFSLVGFFKQNGISLSDQAILEKWWSLVGQKIKRTDLVSLYQNLDKEIARLPEVRLVLAFSPDVAQLERVMSWLRENVDKSMTVKLAVDPRLLAGCKLIWQGKYADYSLRARVESHSAEIRQLVASYEQPQPKEKA